MENNHTCLHEGEIATLQAEVKSIFGILEEQKESSRVLQELVTSVKVMAEGLRTTNLTLDGVKKDVEELKGKPGKRWESVVTYILTAAAGVLAGFIAHHFGL